MQTCTPPTSVHVLYSVPSAFPTPVQYVSAALWPLSSEQPAPQCLVLSTQTNIGLPEQVSLAAQLAPKNVPLGKHEFSLPKHENPLEQLPALQARIQWPPAASEQVRIPPLMPLHSASPAEPLQFTTQVPLMHDMVELAGPAPQLLPVAQAAPGNEPLGKHAFSVAKQE